MPRLTVPNFLNLMAGAGAFMLAAFYGANGYSAPEREARWCVMAPLMLLKVIFHAMLFYLFSLLSFLLPFLLIYFPFWHSNVCTFRRFSCRWRYYIPFRTLFYGCSMMASLAVSVHYT